MPVFLSCEDAHFAKIKEGGDVHSQMHGKFVQMHVDGVRPLL
jgi:hypothetical protein